MDAAVFGNVLAADDGVVLVLFVVHAVADGDALGLEGIDFTVLPADIAHTGVHQQMPPIGHFHGAAGEAAILVVVLIGGQSRGQALPFDEIPGFHMAPVHGAPFHIVGMILIKQVIFPFVGCKAVGIVDPADSAGDMELWQLRSHIGAVFFLKIPGAL